MKCPYCNNEVRDGAKHCGQCGSSLESLKKRNNAKTIIIIICAVIGIAVIAFLLNQTTDNKESTRTASTGSHDSDGLNEEKIIYNNNNIKIYYVSYGEKYLPTFTYRIENNSEYDIFVSSDNESVNDCMITTILLQEVAAGKKATTDMVFYDSDLTDNNITKIEKLEFVLKISQANYYGDSPIDDEKSIVIEF